VADDGEESPRQAGVLELGNGVARICTIDYDSLPIVGTALQAMFGLGKLA
jgi:hypothetical protein